MNKKKLSNQKGITFVELILVVSLVTVLGSLSTVFYTRFLTQNSVSNAADQLAGQLRKAQLYSMMGRQNSSWGVRFASNQITLFSSSSPSFDESFNVNQTINVTGFSSVTFAKGTGIPSLTAPSISVTGNGISKSLSINAQGVVNR